MNGYLICDPIFEGHSMPSSHPEGPDRASVIREGLDGIEHPAWERLQPRDCDRSRLETIHSPDYIERVQNACERESSLDADTPVTSDSFHVARHAVGSAIHLARRGLSEKSPGFGVLRPPGHHAKRDRGMGFCLFNNIAIAAHFAAQSGQKVAVVDIDVHHGNGTQQAFFNRSDVFYVSFHQFPFYPGTGAETEIGTGEGTNYTLNCPVPAGSGWDRIGNTWNETIIPRLEDFEPDYLMVSAGFDGHSEDPLGGLSLTDENYLTIANDLRTIAGTDDGRQILGVLEGGYNRDVLQRLVPQFVNSLISHH